MAKGKAFESKHGSNAFSVFKKGLGSMIDALPSSKSRRLDRLIRSVASSRSRREVEAAIESARKGYRRTESLSQSLRLISLSLSRVLRPLTQSRSLLQIEVAGLRRSELHQAILAMRMSSDSVQSRNLRRLNTLLNSTAHRLRTAVRISTCLEEQARPELTACASALSGSKPTSPSQRRSVSSGGKNTKPLRKNHD